jgi:DNA-binding LacI/PurR family transcriptional regulator
MATMSRRSASVTIHDVARKAGVFIATVSCYMNRNVTVSLVVSQRLDRVLDELKYVPQAAARKLASRKARLIDLLPNHLHHDFLRPLLNGVITGVDQ